MDHCLPIEHPDFLSDSQTSELIAASRRVGDIPEYWLQDWAGIQTIEVRPSQHTAPGPRPGSCQDFDVLVGSGIDGYHVERLQAKLRIEVYDNGTPDGLVEVTLKAFAPNRD